MTNSRNGYTVAVMDLDTYRKAENLTLDQLADLIGVSGRNPARTVQRYLTGERSPDRATIHRINVATQGKVTDADFPMKERGKQAAEAA